MTKTEKARARIADQISVITYLGPKLLEVALHDVEQ